MSRRTPILKVHVGKAMCSTWRSPNGTNLKICVTGRKYGFSAELIGKTGQVLPVSTGEARTPREAMSNAKAFLDRVASKHN